MAAWVKLVQDSLVPLAIVTLAGAVVVLFRRLNTREDAHIAAYVDLLKTNTKALTEVRGVLESLQGTLGGVQAAVEQSTHVLTEVRTTLQERGRR